MSIIVYNKLSAYKFVVVNKTKKYLKLFTIKFINLIENEENESIIL